MATVTVTLRKSILDTQGKAVHHALESLGMNVIKDVRIGKSIVLRLDTADRGTAQRITEEACKKLLANPVMEDCSFILEQQ